jgi:pyridoxine 5-phosphate synthase
MAMLVPEGREEITTEGGLDVRAQEARLKGIVAQLADAGIRTSVFIDPDLAQVEASARIGARVCEVHTGPYAHAFHAKGRDPESAAVVTELDKIRAAGDAIRALGMRFNAGHALNCSTCSRLRRCPACVSCTSAMRRVALGVRRAARSGGADEGAAARGSDVSGRRVTAAERS